MINGHARLLRVFAGLAFVALCVRPAIAADPRVIQPVVTNELAKIAVGLAAYAVVLAGSGMVIRFFILPKGTPPLPPPPPGQRFNISTLIGKCENIIAVSCLLAGEISGLALIFAAKSWVRAKEIEKNPTFYLGGTLVNLTWSMFVGGVARLLVAGA
jgi:hypothetical protein